MLQQSSLAHDGDAVAEPERLVDVVRHEDDRRAEAPLDAEQVVLRLAADDRVERAERLVHQQHVRLRGQRAGDPDALLLAARQFVRKLRGVEARVELEQFEQFGDALR